MSCGRIRDLSINSTTECSTSFGQDTKVLCLVHIDHLEKAKKKYPNSIICTLTDGQFRDYTENRILPDQIEDINGNAVRLKGLM